MHFVCVVAMRWPRPFRAYARRWPVARESSNVSSVVACYNLHNQEKEYGGAKRTLINNSPSSESMFTRGKALEYNQ